MDPIAVAIDVGDRVLAHLRRQCPTHPLVAELTAALDSLEAYHLDLVLRGVCPAEVPAETPADPWPEEVR